VPVNRTAPLCSPLKRRRGGDPAVRTTRADPLVDVGRGFG